MQMVISIFSKILDQHLQILKSLELKTLITHKIKSVLKTLITLLESRSWLLVDDSY